MRNKFNNQETETKRPIRLNAGQLLLETKHHKLVSCYMLSSGTGDPFMTFWPPSDCPTVKLNRSRALQHQDELNFITVISDVGGRLCCPYEAR